MPGAKRWCFTLNNFSPQEYQHIADAYGSGTLEYIVAGRETGESGTPHVQGFVCFNSRVSLQHVKSFLGARLHCEVSRGTPQEASDYCKKDGDFLEFGTLPAPQGKRSDWDAYKDWVVSLGRVPTDLEIAHDFPSLFARYHAACRTIAESALPRPKLVPDGANLRDWQGVLVDALKEPCDDDRSVLFYVDPTGNSGKSWLCRYMLQHYEARVQLLGIGRVVDMAFMVDAEKDIFLIDCERSASEFLQYRVLEQLKNRLVTSTKYSSVVKILRKIPHVVVFMNEEPDQEALSADRYIIEHLN